MAETAAPARKRTATPAKKVTEPTTTTVPSPEATVAPVEAQAATQVRTPVAYEPHPEGDTKNFARFNPVPESGCRGTLYVPLGTVDVKTLLISETE